MKLRLDGRSLRLRLTDEDIHALAAHGEVVVAMALPDDEPFAYRLVRSAGTRRVRWDRQGLTVAVTDEEVAALAQREVEAVLDTLTQADGAALTVAVERDRGRRSERHARGGAGST